MAKSKGKHQKQLGKGLLGPVPKALQPTSKKKIKKQSFKLMKKLYKPAMKELTFQQKQEQSIYNKRQSDNQYYLDWLDDKASELASHGAAADQALTQSQAQIQQQQAEAIQQLQQNLVNQGNVNAGNVSNAGQYTGFNLQPENVRAQGMVAAERTRTSQQQQSAASAAGVARASNVAMQMASSMRAQADLANRMKEIANSREKVKLERAAKSAEEVARLMDQEIAKGQARVDMRNLAAQLALGLKGHRLQKAQLALDEKLGMKGLKLDAKELAEEKRHNKESEEDADKDRHSENKQNQQEAAQEAKEQAQKMKRAIFNTLSIIDSRPRLQTWLDEPGGFDKVVRFLQKHGVDPLAAQAAAEVRSGGLSNATRKRLRKSGFKIPNAWLG